MPDESKVDESKVSGTETYEPLSRALLQVERMGATTVSGTEKHEPLSR